MERQPSHAAHGSPGTQPYLIAAGVALIVSVLAGVVMLWAYHGPAVFFDVIVAGIMSCF